MSINGEALPVSSHHGIPFENFDFAPVILLPDAYQVRDFRTRENVNRAPSLPYSIGRYNEDRVGMYEQDLFEGRRTIHMGIDIGAPLETPVHAFWDGWIDQVGYNPAPGDYGNVIITRHTLAGIELWALHGHLSAESIRGKKPGQTVQRGQVLGTLGSESENGGWPIHLHFQLSLRKPQTHDLPGVVAREEHAQALLDYPDPRLVLGDLY